MNPFGPERISPATTSGHPMDEQANDFACAILMPEEPFRKAYTALSGNSVRLGLHFKVPATAVLRRMAMLGIQPLHENDRWST